MPDDDRALRQAILQAAGGDVLVAEIVLATLRAVQAAKLNSEESG